MNKLTKALLGSVALSALTAVPAVSHPSHPAFRVTAMHGGHAVNKTKLHAPCSPQVKHCDYTFGVYSYQSAAAPKKTPLIYSFYKWNSYSSLCTAPRQKIKAPKKSVYARISTGTQTYSLGCTNGPVTFYGDFWSNKTGTAGKVDTFSSSLMGTFRNRYGKYKAELDLNVDVFIQ
jgi:hypothetical protein